MNARGDELGAGGKIVKTREQILQDYYNNNPRAIKDEIIDRKKVKGKKLKEIIIRAMPINDDSRIGKLRNQKGDTWETTNPESVHNHFPNPSTQPIEVSSLVESTPRTGIRV